MKNIMIVSLMLGSVGCSSLEYADPAPLANEEAFKIRANMVEEIDAVYCKLTGISRYYENETHFNFVCKDGSPFRVPK